MILDIILKYFQRRQRTFTNGEFDRDFRKNPYKYIIQHGKPVGKFWLSRNPDTDYIESTYISYNGIQIFSIEGGISLDRPNKVATISHIRTHNSFKRQGYARFILDTLAIELYDNFNIRQIVFDERADSEEYDPFFQKLGATETLQHGRMVWVWDLGTQHPKYAPAMKHNAADEAGRPAQD